MTGRALKPANTLVVGDVVMSSGTPDAEVVAIEESVQIIRKPVYIVTLRLANGRTTHRQYHPSSTVAIRLKGSS